MADRVAASEPINFLSLLQSADQQASAFLHQKLKITVTGPEERLRIDLRARWGDDDASQMGRSALSEAAAGSEERPAASSTSGQSATSTTSPQKALNSEEQEVFLLNVSELPRGVSAMTLTTEPSWAPPIFYGPRLIDTNSNPPSLRRGFENLEESGKDGIVDGVLEHGAMVFGGVAKSELGSYCTQYILEHGSERSIAKCRSSTFPPGRTSRAARAWSRRSRRAEGDDRPRRAVNVQVGEGARRAMGVDVALSLTGCQLIASASLRLTTTSALYDPRTRTFTHMYHLSHTLLYQILKTALAAFLVFSWRCCLT
ncbi:hypothetical protein B0H14DRAFT_3452333 [Mycena olivaceomarginata]|nr:hypothetical protein B0H14DRAFT_3452333 [Mycena olivaceomarginata]